MYLSQALLFYCCFMSILLGCFEPCKDLLNVNKNSIQFNSVMGIESRDTHTHTHTQKLQQIGQI